MFGARFRGGMVGAVVAGLLGGAALEAGTQRFDSFGRRIEPGAAPLVVGPAAPAAWRRFVDIGMELPVGVDQGFLRAGVATPFRMQLPLPGTSRTPVEIVVENVYVEGAEVPDLPDLPRLPGTATIFSGTVRGRPEAIVVLSVVNDVLYSRVALGNYAWVILSDPRGQAHVTVEERPDGDPVPPPGLQPVLPPASGGVERRYLPRFPPR